MVVEIWRSFRALPLWVQIWIAVILVPVNLASVFFVGETAGLWIAALAIGGMAPNLIIMAVERGLSKLMSLPHVLLWPLLFPLAFILLAYDASPAFRTYLIILLIVDGVSLAFDIPDFRKWLRGDRAIAGK